MFSTKILLITQYFNFMHNTESLLPLIINCGNKNQFHAHIKTINNHTYEHSISWESLKMKTPNYLYILFHIYHVTIIIQSSPQALSTISNCYTLIRLDLAKHMLQSLPLDSLPLLRNPCWRMPLDENKLPQPYSRSLYRHLYWVLDANHASLIITTNSHTCPFTYLFTGLHWNCPWIEVNWCIL